MDEGENVVMEEQPPASLPIDAADISQLYTWIHNLNWSFRMLRDCCYTMSLVSYRYSGRMDPPVERFWHEIEMAEEDIQGAMGMINRYMRRAWDSGINIEAW